MNELYKFTIIQLRRIHFLEYLIELKLKEPQTSGIDNNYSTPSTMDSDIIIAQFLIRCLLSLSQPRLEGMYNF